MKRQAFLVPEPSKSDRARLRLLEAAVEIFGRQGPEGATVREIARAAGQNVAAIAYYFGGKDDLYRAVMEGIVRAIRQELGDVLEQVRQLQARERPEPAEARRLFKLFLREVYLRLLSRRDAVAIMRLVVREQLGPTPAFEILYEQGFKELHRALCLLLGVALGRDPRDRELILRTHTFMGQVYFFAMSREAIMRRMGWDDLGGTNAELVVRILEENLEVLLAAFAETKRSRKLSSSRS